MGNAQCLPFRNVVMCDRTEILRIIMVPGQLRNDRHRLDSDHAFQGEVRLVADSRPIGLAKIRLNTNEADLRQWTSEIIRGDLVSRVESLIHQEGGPLFEDLVVSIEIIQILGAHEIRQGHDDHVATFFQRHLLIVPSRVARRIGVAAANVMHRPAVRVQAVLLDLKQRI